MNVKVGDEVRVFDGRSADGEQGTVVKVGRKLVTIKGGWGWESVYRLDTQQGNGPQYGYGTWFKTLDQVAEDERKRAVMDVLTNAGVTFGYRAIPFTTDQLEELAALIQGWSTDA